ncbi:MAG: hypothetical protein KatS3mg023_3487 [Armatimonadota bacterium]|nr:MAG: hypothetical protein KatS3mg023_3487 [Armatimonadota bacterium]
MCPSVNLKLAHHRGTSEGVSEDFSNTPLPILTTLAEKAIIEYQRNTYSEHDWKGGFVV